MKNTLIALVSASALFVGLNLSANDFAPMADNNTQLQLEGGNAELFLSGIINTVKGIFGLSKGQEEQLKQQIANDPELQSAASGLELGENIQFGLGDLLKSGIDKVSSAFNAVKDAVKTGVKAAAGSLMGTPATPAAEPME